MLQVDPVRAISFPVFCMFLLMASVQAKTIDGIYNTGASQEEDGPSGTLDVEFHPCADDEERSCGTIVRVNNPAPNSGDTLPDGSPIIGFTMITGLKDKGDGEYRGGKINAIDESLSKDEMIWYGVKIDQEDGQLKVKGCLGFICPKTMYWKKVNPVVEAAGE